jgi:hypothetical protein
LRIAAKGEKEDRSPRAVIRIPITPAAFDAIAATVPLGSVGFERDVGANGERQVWLATTIVNRLVTLREPGESYSDVILRLVELETGRRLSSSTRGQRDTR